MGKKKCCKSEPPCKGCPKRKKGKHAGLDASCPLNTVNRGLMPIYLCPAGSTLSISGQRG